MHKLLVMFLKKNKRNHVYLLKLNYLMNLLEFLWCHQPVSFVSAYFSCIWVSHMVCSLDLQAGSICFFLFILVQHTFVRGHTGVTKSCSTLNARSFLLHTRDIKRQKHFKSAMKQHYRKLNPELRAGVSVVTIKITISMKVEPFHLTSTHLYEDEPQSSLPLHEKCIYAPVVSKTFNNLYFIYVLF